VSSNLFGATAQIHLAEISATVWRDENFAAECRHLSRQIKAAVANYAIVVHPNAGRIYAYEIDGFGNVLFKDDPQKFTRTWFAWAYTLFGEMILKLRAERPYLLKSKL
jgi:meiotically up-regulated gene 157 (Mug157) protein